VHETVGGRFQVEAGPKRHRGRNPLRDQAVVRDRVAVGQHAQRDLGAVAVQRLPEHPAASVRHGDARAGVGFDVGEIGSIDPWVTALEALLAAGRNNDSLHF
jgi:hypothetical protein